MSVEGVLRQQSGVISRAQALAEGMSSATISRRLTRALWMRLHPRVYFAADHALTAEARLRAAYLWGRPGRDPERCRGGLVARTVARTGGLGGDQDPARATAARGVRVRRSDLDPTDRVQVNGLWVTAIPLTSLEAAVALGSAGSRLLDRALQRRVSVAELYAAHYRNLGRRGSADAAELLRAARDRAASEAERLLVTLLRDAGLTGWRCGYRVDPYELDFAFPAERTAIEVDGWAWHSDVERFRRDRRRQNALVLAGWTVLRFTWHDLTDRPDAVIAEVRRALGQPAA